MQIVTVSNPVDLDELIGKEASCPPYNFTYTEQSIEKYKQLLQERNTYQLFAKHDSDIVGYVAAAETLFPGYLYIAELFVDPSQQKAGIATKLIERVRKHAESNSLKGVITQTEFANEPAKKLYEKLGFEQMDNPDWQDGLTYKLEF